MEVDQAVMSNADEVAVQPVPVPVPTRVLPVPTAPALAGKLKTNEPLLSGLKFVMTTTASGSSVTVRLVQPLQPVPRTNTVPVEGYVALLVSRAAVGPLG